MMVNVSIRWTQGPASFDLDVANGEFLGGTVMIGAGRVSGNRYEFESAGEAKITMRLRASGDEASSPTVVRAVGSGKTLEFRLLDVPSGAPLILEDGRVEVWAEKDVWASL